MGGRFVDPTDPSNFEKATDKKKSFWETLPTQLEVFPIGEIAELEESMVFL